MVHQEAILGAIKLWWLPLAPQWFCHLTQLAAIARARDIRHALLRPWQTGWTARIKVLYGVRPLLQLDNHLMERGGGHLNIRWSLFFFQDSLNPQIGLIESNLNRWKELAWCDTSPSFWHGADWKSISSMRWSRIWLDWLESTFEKADLPWLTRIHIPSCSCLGDCVTWPKVGRTPQNGQLLTRHPPWTGGGCSQRKENGSRRLPLIWLTSKTFPFANAHKLAQHSSQLVRRAGYIVVVTPLPQPQIFLDPK